MVAIRELPRQRQLLLVREGDIDVRGNEGRPDFGVMSQQTRSCSCARCFTSKGVMLQHPAPSLSPAPAKREIRCRRGCSTEQCGCPGLVERCSVKTAFSGPRTFVTGASGLKITDRPESSSPDRGEPRVACLRLSRPPLAQTWRPNALHAI